MAWCGSITPRHVAVWAANCPEWVLIEFGAALAGITLVTVNPAYLAKELAYVLTQSKAVGLLVQQEYRGRNLLSVVEGCAVYTRYGSIRTDHVLFLAAGALLVSVNGMSSLPKWLDSFHTSPLR